MSEVQLQQLIPDRPLGTIQQVFRGSVRPNELFGFNLLIVGLRLRLTQPKKSTLFLLQIGITGILLFQI